MQKFAFSISFRNDKIKMVFYIITLGAYSVCACFWYFLNPFIKNFYL